MGINRNTKFKERRPCCFETVTLSQTMKNILVNKSIFLSQTPPLMKEQKRIKLRQKKMSPVKKRNLKKKIVQPWLRISEQKNQKKLRRDQKLVTKRQVRKLSQKLVRNKKQTLIWKQKNLVRKQEKKPLPLGKYIKQRAKNLQPLLIKALKTLIPTHHHVRQQALFPKTLLKLEGKVILISVGDGGRGNEPKSFLKTKNCVV